MTKVTVAVLSSGFTRNRMENKQNNSNLTENHNFALKVDYQNMMSCKVTGTVAYYTKKYCAIW